MTCRLSISTSFLPLLTTTPSTEKEEKEKTTWDDGDRTSRVVQQQQQQQEPTFPFKNDFWLSLFYSIPFFFLLYSHMRSFCSTRCSSGNQFGRVIVALPWQRTQREREHWTRAKRDNKATRKLSVDSNSPRQNWIKVFVVVAVVFKSKGFFSFHLGSPPIQRRRKGTDSVLCWWPPFFFFLSFKLNKRGELLSV